jgi:hypothetical protein
MKNWPDAFISELESEEYRSFHLLQMEFSPILRYTNCDIDLAYQGNLFTSRGFEVPELEYSISSNIDKVTIEIDMADRDETLLEEFVGGTPGDTPVHLYLQVLNDYMQVISTAVLFSGKIDSFEKDTDNLRVVIASFHSLWNKNTMEVSTPTCRRNFKQPDCGYAGDATWCDRSWARCTALNNTSRFNGFRFIPSLSDRDLFWGRIFGQELPTD